MKSKSSILVFLNFALLVLLGACLGILLYGWITYQDLDTMLDMLLFTALLVTASVAFLCAILAIVGVLGAIRNDNKCLLTFAILIGVSAFVFLAGAIKTTQVVHSMAGETCVSNSVYRLLQQTAQKSQYSICYGCACQLTDQVMAETYSPLQISSFSLYAPNTSNNANPVRCQDCGTWNSSTNQQATQILQSMQTKLGCSGWCRNTSSMLFRFTNVSNGIPRNSCYAEYKSFMSTAGLMIQTFLFALTGVSIIALLFSCLTYNENKGKSNSEAGSHPDMAPACSQESATTNFQHQLCSYQINKCVIN